MPSHSKHCKTNGFRCLRIANTAKLMVSGAVAYKTLQNYWFLLPSHSKQCKTNELARALTLHVGMNNNNKTHVYMLLYFSKRDVCLNKATQVMAAQRSATKGGARRRVEQHKGGAPQRSYDPITLVKFKPCGSGSGMQGSLKNTQCLNERKGCGSTGNH